jgi:hypothetical protein
MLKNRQAGWAQEQSPAHAEPQNSRKSSVVSYVVFSACVAFLLAYWPASARDILATLNIVPQYVAFESAVPDRTHKADRLSGISFEQRWNVIPMLSSRDRGDNSQHRKPLTERRIESAV